MLLLHDKRYMAVSYASWGWNRLHDNAYHPQSNDKIERWHQSLKSDCIRTHVPLSIEEARQLVERFMDDYNHKRLHSSIGYITPSDKLAGRETAIVSERDRKLAEARKRRAEHRQAQREKTTAA